MTSKKLSYNEAADLVARELRGELVSEAALSEALAAYPQIGQKLEAALVTPPPTWSKAGLSAIVQMREEAEREARMQDLFLFIHRENQERQWRTNSAKTGEGWQLEGIRFYAFSTESEPAAAWSLVRVMHDKDNRPPAFSFEKTVPELSLSIILVFFDEDNGDGLYRVVVKLKANDEGEAPDLATFAVSLIPGSDQSEIIQQSNSEGEVIFNEVHIPDIETFQVKVQSVK